MHPVTPAKRHKQMTVVRNLKNPYRGSQRQHSLIKSPCIRKSRNQAEMAQLVEQQRICDHSAAIVVTEAEGRQGFRAASGLMARWYKHGLNKF
ncbi:hypothetical protein [Herminiimonas sp. CN]|uniref:hypothetical protein n=1 Tax=Herminiimonas sp. CN TaxID=1349818 RepID=UPI0012DCFB6D|nr:hypothetical protein [Herminiimonas sp. CN]